jgi:hypothetical protein
MLDRSHTTQSISEEGGEWGTGREEEKKRRRKESPPEKQEGIFKCVRATFAFRKYPRSKGCGLLQTLSFRNSPKLLVFILFLNSITYFMLDIFCSKTDIYFFLYC